MPRHAIFEFSGGQVDAHRKRLLIYGDSLTAGFPDYTPYARSLVDSFASAGLAVSATGCGLCGKTADQMAVELMSRGVHDSCGRSGVGLEKLLQDLSGDEGPFNLAVIMAGTNDVLEGTSGARDICSAIGKLHAACHKYGLHTVALSVPQCGLGPADPRRRTWQEVNDRIGAWASGDAGDSRSAISVPGLVPSMLFHVESVALLPHQGHIDEWEEDGIHFSELGSHRFGAALAHKLFSVLFPELREQGLEVLCVQESLGNLRMEEDAAGALSDAPSEACPKILVVGGSVALGAGASPGQGWVDLLIAAARDQGVEVHNESSAGLTALQWQERLCNLPSGVLDAFSLVFLCLSPSDDGLHLCETAEQCASMVDDFLECLTLIGYVLRGKMRESARLAVAGPHPHGGYQQFHVDALRRLQAAILETEVADLTIDFLQPALQNDCSSWFEGMASGDEAHGLPNSAGHHGMYSCLDLASLLGAR